MNRKITAAITAVGGYVPPDKLTNADLEKMVDTNDEWIRTRTGISERRILRGDGLATSDLVVPAVKDLLEKRGIAAEEIDCMIVATVTPDMTFPATANIACDKLGAKNAWSFDLEAACSGFLYAVTTGAMMIESGRYKKVVVVGADKMSSIVDYSDRNTCVLFGDGAGAILLEPNFEGYGMLDSILRSDGSGINNSFIGLVRYQPCNIIACQIIFFQKFCSYISHTLYSKFENRLPFLVNIVFFICYCFNTGRPQ